MSLLKAKALEAHALEAKKPPPPKVAHGSPWSRRLTAAAMSGLMQKAKRMDSKVDADIREINEIGLDLHTTLDDINSAYQDLKSTLTPMEMERVMSRGMKGLTGEQGATQATNIDEDTLR